MRFVSRKVDAGLRDRRRASPPNKMSSSNSLPFSEIKFARAWISRFSTLLVCLFIIISCQVDFSLALSTEKRLSPRIVTTKYGAVRGFVLSLAARSLQPLEVFLGE